MKRWEAQPDNLAVAQAVNMLRANASVLLLQAYRLTKKLGPKARVSVRRQLSGVLGDVETVRQAIKE